MAAEENPYKAPDALTDGRRGALSAEDEKTARQAQFFLRLLGVLFVVDSFSDLAATVVHAVTPSGDLLALAELGQSYAGFFVGSGIRVAAGLYLILGGRRLIEMVFLPPPPQRDLETGSGSSTE